MDLEGEVQVQGLWENSSADNANIKVGDQIIGFNSKKITSDNYTELVKMMHNDQIESIILQVKSLKGSRKVKLTKKMLF